MIRKIINIFILFILIIFSYQIFRYYMSEKNIKIINQNRSNIKNIVNSNIKNLPLLKNDTNNVIEFNNGFNELKKKSNKNFWNLLN